jgi:sodium-coupled neutral amino acid transporter 11
MPGDEGDNDLLTGQNGQLGPEAQSLLSSPTEELDDLKVHSASTGSPPVPASSTRSDAQRQSSILHPTPDGQRRTPRTTNRVHFDLEEDDEEDDHYSNGHARSPDSDAPWLDDEDYELGEQGRSGVRNTGQTVPLLTNIEAPSVTLATSDDFFPEEHLENARPRSGMKMAFMNMANSIIGAGIIGQPYALRQAGMTMGILLLTALTITVDWTIRLIVVNSKMSGADSFQATMQYCFGRSGLIAISIAQWAFAFGGMVAFCIIVGDTIPHVLGALFPSLREMSFLWLLTDRRAVIVLFVLGISYPLSLYRDIAKVGSFPLSIRIPGANGFIVGESICLGIGQHDSHCGDGYHTGLPCPRRLARGDQESPHIQLGILSSRGRDILWYAIRTLELVQFIC